MKTYDVIVFGAGVAGLSCADELLRKSKSHVLIIEKNNFVGGLAATLKYRNFLFDLSPHRWFTKNQELNKWLDDLMNDELIWIKKYTPMYQFGTLFDYPIKIGDVIRKINLLMQIVMFTTFLFEKIKNRFIKVKIITMKDAYISRFGWGLYKWFNEEYNDKLWGNKGCEKMSADFVDQRVKNLSILEILKNAIGLNKNQVISLVSKFRYPKKGIGRISENLYKRIKNNGGKVNLGEKVISVKKLSKGFKIYTDKDIYVCKKIVSSIPLDLLVRMMFKDNAKMIKIISNLKYIHQKIVVLFANKRKLTNFTWVYVHPKKILTFRFLETNNWSRIMSPVGKTSLVFEYPYQKNDKLESISDNSLIEMTKHDFIKYFASNGVKINNFFDGKVYNVRNAYPKYDLNYKKNLIKIKKALDIFLPNLQYIGRSGMFHYNNLDHSIYTGILAARNIISGKYLFNLDNVNNDAEYLEEIRKA